MRRLLLAFVLLPAGATAAVADAPSPADVVRTYVAIGAAVYGDAYTTGQALGAAVDALIAHPDTTTLAAARDAWKAARVPYGRSEVFRFGNPIVDDWEGSVNSWPLDEGLIDYVSAAYGTESDANPFYTLNVIANPSLRLGARTIDAATITPELLSDDLQEAGDIETNVAIGYHAVEFLLWGQDLNGTGPGSGDRPPSDFDPAHCTGGHCERRVAYLKAATDLLVADLGTMAEAWAPGGAAAERLLSADPAVGLAAMLTGMGSLSYGELAGERMKLGLMLHDPEEEQDCFSDNTYNEHYNDVVGIRGVYLGRYERSDGSIVDGASLSALVAARNPDLDKELTAKLDATFAAATALKTRGDTVEAYDQMLAEGNADGNAAIQAVIDGLVGQVPAIERVVGALELGSIAFEGSDSLDNPDAVFQ